MKKAILLLPLMLLCSCGKPMLHLEGRVEGGVGATVYFEEMALSGVRLIDSTVLTTKEDFSFKTPAPACPEFYRLRLDGKSIHLTADTSAYIRIEARREAFSTDYTVEGSEACRQLKDLSLLSRRAQVDYDSLVALYNQGKLGREELITQVKTGLQPYKNLAREVVLADPASGAAYFALYQRIHGALIFNPEDKDDNRLFSAVANSWDFRYPESARTENLKALALRGLAVIRQERQAQEPTFDIPVQEVDRLPFFDISLPDVFGRNTSLSELKGKVILLDFTAYAGDYSADRVLQLRELYKRYDTKGFEVYQVSLDADEHYWKTAAFNLPWVCVRDARGSASPYLRAYFIQQIPTFFLIDKQGYLVARDEVIDDLDAYIRRLLRE